MERLITLLEDLRLELGAIFEQGLAQSGRREEALRQLGGRMSQLGLVRGGQLADSLSGQLARSRLDSDWQPGEAARLYSRLWRYTTLCLRRLDYLEARANLSHD